MEEMMLPAAVNSLYEILDFVRQFAENHGFKEELLEIELAAEEVFTNIASYAYGSKSGTVTVVCQAETGVEDRLRICFMDTGIPYNPLDHDDPNITLPVELRPVGGLGVFLVKEFMDNVFYEYKEGRNILTIEKRRQRHGI